jgi:hypothetical protein
MTYIKRFLPTAVFVLTILAVFTIFHLVKYHYCHLPCVTR